MQHIATLCLLLRVEGFFSEERKQHTSYSGRQSEVAKWHKKLNNSELVFLPYWSKPKTSQRCLQNGISKRYLFSHRNHGRKYSQSDTGEEVNWKRGFVRAEGPLVPLLLSSPQVIVLAMHFSPAVLWVMMISYMCVSVCTRTHMHTHIYVHSHTCIYIEQI